MIRKLNVPDRAALLTLAAAALAAGLSRELAALPDAVLALCFWWGIAVLIAMLIGKFYHKKIFSDPILRLAQIPVALVAGIWVAGLLIRMLAGFGDSR